MLSYHADADIHTNPFELGLDRLVNLDMEADFIGKAALRRIKEQGITRKQVGLIIARLPMTAGGHRLYRLTGRDFPDTSRPV
jgi:glycine cleavage system aminomethyltransferase T